MSARAPTWNPIASRQDTVRYDLLVEDGKRLIALDHGPTPKRVDWMSLDARGRPVDPTVQPLPASHADRLVDAELVRGAAGAWALSTLSHYSHGHDEGYFFDVVTIANEQITTAERLVSTMPAGVDDLPRSSRACAASPGTRLSSISAVTVATSR